MYNDLSSFTSEWFVESFYNDEQRIGGCEEWLAFSRSAIPARETFYAPINVELSVLQWPQNIIVSASCSNASDVEDIVNGLSSLSRIGARDTFRCEEHVWKLEVCAAGVVSVCVDCANPCRSLTSVCRDEEATLTISACNVTDNPNDECPLRHGVGRLLSVTYMELSPAPVISSIVAISDTATSIAVTVNVSDDASIYCATYEDLAAIPTVSEVIVYGVVMNSQLGSSGFRLVSLRINGLVAVTNYSVFCAVESNVGLTSSVEAVLATKSVIETQCCRSIVLTSNFDGVAFIEGNVLYDIITLSVLFPPTVPVTAVIHIYDNVTSINVTDSLFPTNTASFSSSMYLANTFSMNSLQPGTYNVVSSIVGAGASFYSIDLVGSSTFTVLPDDTEPATPKLSSITFSRRGLFVNVKFDAATDMSGLASGDFRCRRLFSFDNVNSVNCRWNDNTNVSLLVAGFSDVVVGTNITLRSNVLKAACTSDDCSSWSYVSSTTVAVQAPAVVLVPTVSIISSSSLGRCDNMSVDLSGSAGSGGREWESISFSVVDVSGSQVTALRDHLNAEAAISVTEPIIATSSMLSGGETYSISVTMCNFLGGCGTRSFQVRVLSSSSPTVIIGGAAVRYIKTDSTFRLQAEGRTTTCLNNMVVTTSSNIIYTWTVYSSDGNAIPTIQSRSRNPQTFLISPYTLDVGEVYDVTVSAYDSSLQRSSSSTTQVVVEAGVVVAELTGVGNIATLPVGRSITLDASSSYDEDDRFGSLNALTFTWSCFRSAPTLSTTCPVRFTVSDDTFSVVVTAVSGSANTNSTLTVTVSASDGRSAASSVIIQGSGANTPTIQFPGLSNNGKLNPTNKKKIEATVETIQSCYMEWFIVETGFAPDPSFELADHVSTPIGRNLTVPLSATSPRLFVTNLVLLENALDGDRSYTLTLTCTTLNGANTGISTQLLLTNGPPSGGVFSVNPSTGTALSTQFMFTAALWDDDDIPISYEYRFTTAGNQLLPLRARSESSTHVGALGRGSEMNSYRLVITLTVYDNLDSSTTKTTTVTSNPSQMSLSGLNDLLSSEISDGTLSVVTDSLNTADCSAAPSDCSSRGRGECSTTDNTCGECLSGYIGDSGAANSLCVLDSSLGSRRLTSSTTNCTSDDDCSVWQECSNVTFLCIDFPKECVSPDCSGHGRCEYTLVSDGSPVRDCFVGNASCIPSCRCNEEYDGPGCSYTSAEYTERQATRGLLLSSLRTLIAAQDPSEFNVNSNIQSLDAICEQAREISVDVAADVLGVYEDIVASMNGLPELKAENIIKLYSPLDTAVAVLSTEMTDDSSIITGLIEDLGLYVLDDMLAGENSFYSIGDLLRIQLYAEDITETSTTSMYTPLTTLESFSGVNPHSVVISEDELLFDTEIKGWIYQRRSSATLNSDGGPAFLAPFVRAQVLVAQSGINLIENGTADGYNYITIQNNRANDFINTSVSDKWRYSVTATCYQGVVNVVYLTCPVSLATFNVSCNGTAGVYRSLCPPRRTIVEPSCVAWNESHITESGCTMIAHDSTFTTCRCPFQNFYSRGPGTVFDDRRRRLLSTTNSVQFSVASNKTTFFTTPVSTSFTVAIADPNAPNKTSFGVYILCGMAGVALLLVLAGYMVDYSDEESIEHEKIVPHEIENSIKSLTVSDAVGDAAAATDMIESALPDIFKDRLISPVGHLFREVLLFHQWLHPLFLCLAPIFPSFRVTASLFNESVLLVFDSLTMLAVSALAYYIMDPIQNDDTCIDHRSDEECSSDYILNWRFLNNRCHWDRVARECNIRSPYDNLWSVVIVAYISALVGIPLILSMRSLFRFFIFAPTLRVTKKEKYSWWQWVQLWIFGQRNILRREMLMEAAEEDLVVLCREARAYYDQLPAGKLKTEFGSEWCLDSISSARRFVNNDNQSDDSDFFEDDAPPAEPTYPIFEYSLWEHFLSFIGIQPIPKSPRELLLADLFRVQEAIAEERKTIIYKVKIGRKELLDDQRVLCSLLEDLLTDKEGEIVRFKRDRDLAPLEPKLHWIQLLCMVVAVVYVWAASIIILYFATTRVEPIVILWLSSCFAWLIMECAVFRPIISVVMEIGIPSFVFHRVNEVKTEISQNILCLDGFSWKDYTKFKWSLMLFASARVAARFYCGRMDKLFLSLSSSFPRRSLNNRTGTRITPVEDNASDDSVYDEEPSRLVAFVESMSYASWKSSFLGIVTRISRTSRLLYSIVGETIVVGVVGFLILLHAYYYLQNRSVITFIPLFAFIFLIICVIALEEYKYNRRKAFLVAPIEDDDDDEDLHGRNNSKEPRTSRDNHGPSAVAPMVDRMDSLASDDVNWSMVQKPEEDQEEEEKEDEKNVPVQEKEPAKKHERDVLPPIKPPVARKPSEWLANMNLHSNSESDEEKDSSDGSLKHHEVSQPQSPNVIITKTNSSVENRLLYRHSQFSGATLKSLPSFNAARKNVADSNKAQPVANVGGTDVLSTMAMIDDVLAGKPPSTSSPGALTPKRSFYDKMKSPLSSSNLLRANSVDSDDLFDVTGGESPSPFNVDEDTVDIRKRLTVLDSVIDELGSGSKKSFATQNTPVASRRTRQQTTIKVDAAIQRALSQRIVSRESSLAADDDDFIAKVRSRVGTEPEATAATPSTQQQPVAVQRNRQSTIRRQRLSSLLSDLDAGGPNEGQQDKMRKFQSLESVEDDESDDEF